jgi:membrane protein
LWRAARSFYDDQMTQHAAAVTYYALMSLFPATLLALSLLGLIGQYPRTYDAIVGYLRGVVPHSTLGILDSSLRAALKHKGTAAGALAVSVVSALYGTTGLSEAIRRALNVVFEVSHGRSFWRRKAVDLLSSLVLGSLLTVTLILVFVGGSFARDIFGFIGLGSTAAHVWSVARWPAAVMVAMLIFTWIYYVTPDVHHRGFRWLAPGAATAVAIWMLASVGFSLYLSRFANVSGVYGAFTGLILLVVWLWLGSVALLFGAELNAEIEREKEIEEGIPPRATLALGSKTS